MLGWIIALVWALTVDPQESNAKQFQLLRQKNDNSAVKPLEDLLIYCKNFIRKYPKSTLLTITLLLIIGIGSYRIQEHFEGQEYLLKLQYQDSIKTADLINTWGPNYAIRMDSAKKAEENLRPFTELENAQELLFDPSKVDLNSISAFNVTVNNFKIVAKAVNSYKISCDKKLCRNATALEKKLIAHQKKWFPFLRKKYTKLCKSTLWHNDVNVYASGVGNTAINLEGYYFASNSVISNTHSTLSDMLRQLRFRRANYKFSEYSEYTYYDINSLSDAALQ